MVRWYNAVLLSVTAVVWLPMQSACTECTDPNGIERKYVCDCCHGPGCFGLPGKAAKKRVTVCAPDATVAQGMADEEMGSSDSTCGGCREKGEGEGTGDDATERTSEVGPS